MPIQAIRWVDNAPYAAVTTSPDRTQWRWQPIEIGLMNEFYAEVLKGLNAGDKIVANPTDLTAPAPPGSPDLQAGGNTVQAGG